MDDERIKITDELRAEVRAEIERVGAGIAKLMRGRKDVPRGFTSARIMGIARGCFKSVWRSHLEYARKLWTEATPYKRIPYESVGKIKARFDELRISPRTLLAIKDAPDDLTPTMICGWWARKDAATIRTDHLEWVTQALSDPALEPSDDSTLSSRHDGWRRKRVMNCPELDTPVTSELRDQLLAHQERTGLGAGALLNGREDLPHGLTPAMAYRWFTGQARAANAEHLSYVLELYEQVTPMLRLTKDDRNQLYTHKYRIGGSWADILRRMGQPPDGLTAKMLAEWAAANRPLARKDLWDFTIKGLESLPDSDVPII